jgi:hypothetical protein
LGVSSNLIGSCSKAGGSVSGSADTFSSANLQ